MRCALTSWEGLRSTPHGKTHGHKLSQAGQGGPVERRDTEIILLSGGEDASQVLLEKVVPRTRRGICMRNSDQGKVGPRHLSPELLQ
jgi:hypothetical protein